MSRQKLVYPTNEIPHLWAHKTQDEARNPQNNLYFRGDTIYSYGSHFPIARHVKNKKGETAVLFNKDIYSSVTARHCSAVRNAIPYGSTVFTVLDVTKSTYIRDLDKEGHARNLKEMVASATQAWTKALRARQNKAGLIAESERWIEQANAYAAFFGIKKTFKNIDPEEIERQKEEAKREEAKYARQQKKLREEKEVALAAERIEKAADLQSWLTGASEYLPSCFTYNTPSQLLRVVKADNENGYDEDTIETSLGARIPLAHAVKLLPFLRKGTPYAHNGHSIHLGNYRVDSIDEAGNLKAGCHYIERTEIERLAATLGL